MYHRFQKQHESQMSLGIINKASLFFLKNFKLIHDLHELINI